MVMMKTMVFVFAAAAAAAAGCPATLVEWQGCPDCTKYGEGLVEKGLDRGLGPLMNMTVLFIKGHHPGIKADPKFLPFAACAQHVQFKDPNYLWYGVLVCANPGKTIAECEEQRPLMKAQAQLIHQCMSNATLSDQLVTTMNKKASAIAQDYPWAIVNGVTMPEPDTHRDDITPFINAVCACKPNDAPACKK